PSFACLGGISVAIMRLINRSLEFGQHAFNPFSSPISKHLKSFKMGIEYQSATLTYKVNLNIRPGINPRSSNNMILFCLNSVKLVKYSSAWGIFLVSRSRVGYKRISWEGLDGLKGREHWIVTINMFHLIYFLALLSFIGLVRVSKTFNYTAFQARGTSEFC
ncbi:Hypothetical predicted protein, partial [Pelobates cultripes]